VGKRDRARIGAYLLGRLPQEQRDEFEARMLEEPQLLAAVRNTEAAILGGAHTEAPAAHGTGLLFAAGVATGAVLTWLVLVAS
jgi:hypothetical protein